jgi:hypothetical protein
MGMMFYFFDSLKTWAAFTPLVLCLLEKAGRQDAVHSCYFAFADFAMFSDSGRFRGLVLLFRLFRFF